MKHPIIKTSAGKIVNTLEWMSFFKDNIKIDNEKDFFDFASKWGKEYFCK